MTIIGANQENAIINGGKLAGSPANIFIILSGVKITINDLTIENGYNDNNGLGGAINNKGTLTINSVTFTENSAAEYGGAIYNTGNLNVNSCTFNNNIANDNVNDECNGGAIYNSGKLTVNKSAFNNNTSINDDGAIFNNQQGRLIVNNSSFTGDSSSKDGYGGAIGNDGMSTINDSTFTLNSAAPGGAIGNMTITSCIFNNNSATMFGGAIINDGTLNITSSNFNNNNANQGNGGAVSNLVNLTLGNNNTFTKNLAANGGAIFNAGKLTITKNNTFISNKASSNGGAIYNSLFVMNGQNYEGNAIIESSTFKANTASYGGAIENEGILTVKTSTFTDNAVTNDGGAIYYEPGVSIEPSAPAKPAEPAVPTPPAKAAAAAAAPMAVVVNAATAKYGGAIFNENNLTVTGCTFESNIVFNGNGGAIFNGLHIKAAAPVKAKAVALLDTLSRSSTDNGPYLTIRKSSFVDNNAINGDGGVITTTGDANINFSRIIGNSAINGSSIYNSGDLMDASLNWWGSNMDPSSNVYGNVTVTPWLILKMIANPNIIENGASQITAELLYDSNGVYHDPTIGKLPEGIPVTFTGSDGTFNPTSGILVDGQAKSLFTANADGKTSISTTIDNQTVTISITSDLQTITSNSNNPTIGVVKLLGV
jgi:predicted outer membrane repeat protein